MINIKELKQFYKALNQRDVLNLIDQGVDLSQFNIIKDKYYKIYSSKALEKIRGFHLWSI